MYDLGDLVVMLGELVSLVLAAFFLVAGVAAGPGRRGAYFIASALLCGISFVTGGCHLLDPRSALLHRPACPLRHRGNRVSVGTGRSRCHRFFWFRN
jgi:hypothetical protein